MYVLAKIIFSADLTMIGKRMCKCGTGTDLSVRATAR